MTMKPLDDILRDDLHDPEFVAAYIQASLEEDGVDGLMYALQHIARVRAETAKTTAEPSFRSIYETIQNLGLNFRVVRNTETEAQTPALIK